jgi:hypothetical protein
MGTKNTGAILDIHYGQGSTNPLICSCLMSEKSRPSSEKTYDLFTNICFHSLLDLFSNGKFIAGMGMRPFVNVTLLCLNIRM